MPLERSGVLLHYHLPPEDLELKLQVLLDSVLQLEDFHLVQLRQRHLPPEHLELHLLIPSEAQPLALDPTRKQFLRLLLK